MPISISVEYLFWLFPILISVSFVMAATRHERNAEIIDQTWRTALWTLAFLGIIALLLWLAMLRIG